MKVDIESVHFTADQKLLEHIQEKLGKTEQRFDKIVNTRVILRLENSGQVKDKIAEFIVKVPGATLVSKGVSKTFEAAVNEGVKTLTRQIKRYKEKLRND